MVEPGSGDACSTGDSTEIDSCSLPAALLDGVLGRNKSRLVPSGVGFARLSGAIPPGRLGR